MATTSVFPLLELPDEIVLLIIENITEQKTLRRLARTSKRMQALTEYALYRSILIRSKLATKRICKALDGRRERASAILRLHVPCVSDDHPDFGDLVSLIRSARNIKDFMFESPACNSSDFEEFDTWHSMTNPIFTLFAEASLSSNIASPSERPLQSLQKLTLHLNGPESPYWRFDSSSSHILLHPTLQELKLSCVDIDKIPLRDVKAVHVSPLRHLWLEECNITHQGLKALLASPKALQTIHIGENCHNLFHFARSPLPYASNQLFEKDSKLAVDALKLQKHSLKSLTYVTMPEFPNLAELASPNPYTVNAVDGGFDDFTSLEEVYSVGYCPNFERAVISMSPPPSLRHISYKAKKVYRRQQHATVSTESATIQTNIPFLRAPSPSIPKSLKTLAITYTADHGMMVVDLVYQGSKERSFIQSAYKALAEMGIDLLVSATRLDSDLHYYPPYLYGEPQPQEDLVFSRGNFVGVYKASERRLSRIARSLVGLGRDPE